MKNIKIKVIIFVFIFAIIGVLAFRFWGQAESEVIKGEVVLKRLDAYKASQFKKEEKVVFAVGKLESAKQVDLKSQLSGEVKKVYVKIGDKVKKGDVLLELDASLINAQLQQASAGIERAKAGLAQRVAGAGDEEITRAKKAVEQAQSSLNQVIVANEAALKRAQLEIDSIENAKQNSQKSTEQALQNSYDNLRVVLQNTLPAVLNSLTVLGNLYGEKPGEEKADVLFENLLSVRDPQIKYQALGGFEKTKTSYEASKELINKLSANSSFNEINQASVRVENLLYDLKTAIELARKTLDNTITSATFTEPMLSNLKTNLDGQMNSVGALISQLNLNKQAIVGAGLSDDSSYNANRLAHERAWENLEQTKKQGQASLEGAQAALAIQKAAYDILVANPREVDLLGLKSSIREAEASYNLLAVNKDKSFIKAPFDGTVSAVPVIEYSLASAGQTVVSMVNMNDLQVRAFVREEDRRFIEEGALVEINKNISAVLTQVSPSLDPMTRKVEIIISLTGENPDLTVGQSIEASIDIKNEYKQSDIYILPLRSLILSQNETFLFLLHKIDSSSKQAMVKKAPIKMGGIEGGNIEVLSGIIDDDFIIIDDNKELEDGEKITLKNLFEE